MTPLSLTFGIAEGYEATDTSSAFTALAAWMREQAAVDLTRRTAKTYRDLTADVRTGACDLAWLPPVVYAWLAESVTPLGSIVREGSTGYAAALVVLAASPRKELADLKGSKIAWVDPWSAAGFVVPRIELARAGMDPFTMFAKEAFLGTHREALRALVRGDVDVAATFARKKDARAPLEGGWTELEAEGSSFRVISAFGSIPPDVVAVRRNLGPREHERAIEAFRQASGDVEARALLRAVFGGDTLHEGTLGDHEALRRVYERGVADGLFD